MRLVIYSVFTTIEMVDVYTNSWSVIIVMYKCMYNLDKLKRFCKIFLFFFAVLTLFWKTGGVVLSLSNHP